MCEQYRPIWASCFCFVGSVEVNYVLFHLLANKLKIFFQDRWDRTHDLSVPVSDIIMYM